MCFVSRRQGPTGRTSLKPPMLAQRQARPALRRRGPRAAHAPHPRPALRLSAVGWWAGVTWARLASSSRRRAGPRAGFRFGGSEMTEPGVSPEDPWVKASPVGAHAGEGRAGGARARRGAGGRGNSLQSLKSPLLSRPRGCREDSSHPACAKVGRQPRRVCASEGPGAGEGRRAGGRDHAGGRCSTAYPVWALRGIL